MSRAYNLGVWANRTFPGLVDFFSVQWVRKTRREELKQIPDSLTLQAARYPSLGSRIALMSAGMVLGVLAARTLIHRARPTERLVRRARKIERKVTRSLAEQEPEANPSSG
jgi:hypothetical protein